MSGFKEIKIKVKLIDNGNVIINNEDGICTEIEAGNDFYNILPLIKRKLANGVVSENKPVLHKHDVMVSALNKRWAENRHIACDVRGEVAIRWALGLYADCDEIEIDEAVNEFRAKSINP